MSSCKSTLNLIATVTNIANDKAFIQFNKPQQQSCSQCENKGGCQSLSLKNLFLTDKNLKLVIKNQGFHINDNIAVSFPNAMLLQSIAFTIGLPFLVFVVSVISLSFIHELLGFFVGLIAMAICYFFTKKYVVLQMQKQLSFTKIAV